MPIHEYWIVPVGELLFQEAKQLLVRWGMPPIEDGHMQAWRW
jgi:hypothetical protein